MVWRFNEPVLASSASPPCGGTCWSRAGGRGPRGTDAPLRPRFQVTRAVAHTWTTRPGGARGLPRSRGGILVRGRSRPDPEQVLQAGDPLRRADPGNCDRQIGEADTNRTRSTSPTTMNSHPRPPLELQPHHHGTCHSIADPPHSPELSIVGTQSNDVFKKRRLIK